jgi:hypothetical protein
VQVFRARGLLYEPVVVSHSVFDAMLTFVGEGIKHILEGLDQAVDVFHFRHDFDVVTGAKHLLDAESHDRVVVHDDGFYRHVSAFLPESGLAIPVVVNQVHKFTVFTP